MINYSLHLSQSLGSHMLFTKSFLDVIPLFPPAVPTDQVFLPLCQVFHLLSASTTLLLLGLFSLELFLYYLALLTLLFLLLRLVGFMYVFD